MSSAWRPGYEPQTEEEVRELLKRITLKNGYVSDERRKILERDDPDQLVALDGLKIQISTLVERVSTELYSSDAHFIYELIQNADDNFYSHAIENGQLPELVITLSNDRIVFENNENGFRRANVEAISQAATSTKQRTADQTFTGEKGIGFKACFKIADKVHIESNLYSFAFQFARHSALKGYSTISPLPEPYSRTSSYATCITLSQFYEFNFAELKRELDRIPNSILLFLRQLKSLVIRINSEEESHEVRWSLREFDNSGFEQIDALSSSLSKKASDSSTEKRTKTVKFFVRKRLISGLPDDSARLIKNTDTHITTAEAILAFPLSHDEEPLIDDQFTYAFLPMQKFGFSFIIQCDFVTLTTREDVKDSRRNRALLDGIAEAFSDAVEELCDRKTLRYTWMRFLPDDRISSNFWRDLGPKIYASLRTRPILEPFRGNTNISSDTHSKVLEKVGCLYILPDYFLDNVDQPLLRATNEISYMSLNYSFLDRARLRRIGVQILDHIEILKLLKQDLKNYASWWRSLDRSTDWQTKMSQVLIGAWDNPACKAILRNMEIVALKNGTWSVPCGGAKLLFPASGEADIPDDLGLELIHPDNIKNPQRAILMKALLVQQASPKQVVEKIILQHRIARPFNSIDKGVQQFIYLFWHGSAEPQSGSMYELQFSCHAGKFRRASHIVYLPMKDDNLGPQKLFEAINAEPVKAPSYSALFINDCYLYAIDDAVRNDTGQSWTSWLTTTVGILKQPRLYHNVRLVSEITPEFAHIMKHRPDVLIQLLHRYQQHYCPIPDIHIPQFRKTKVLCEMQELICLWKCVLPTTELRKLTKDLGLQRFPFLQLDRDIEMIDLHQWSFAQKLGVLTTDSLSFYVMCLKLVHRVLEADPTTAALQILTKIQDKCFPKNRVWLRNSLRGLPWIFIPSIDNSNLQWTVQEDCRWTGPSWLSCRHVLSSIKEYRNLQTLLCAHMEVKNATWEDSIEELNQMKTNSKSDQPKVRTIYESLWSEFSKDKIGTLLREIFEKNSLIFTSEAGWLAPSACVWAPKKVKVDGKTSIQHIYRSSKELEEMFVQGLQVPKPSLEMHVATLRALAKTNVPVSAIVEVMAHISELKRPEGELRQKLQNLNIFPVRQRNGMISRTSLSVEFAIIDKSIYRRRFDDLICVLDFDDHQFWRTSGFLIACGLRSQFMSECVMETTGASNPTPFVEKTQEIRSKAYAFLRYAVHFRSIKTLDSHSDLYQSLKKINVSTSNSISKKLSITQAGETFNVTLQKADVHLEGEDSLDIYVPTDPRGFKRCWPIDIIPRIKIWLGVSDVLGNDVLQQIFIRDDLELLDEDLEKKGIRTVDGVHRDPKHTGITSNPSIGRITTAPPENQPFGYSLPGATPNASSSTCTQDLRLRVSSNVRPELRTTTSGMGRGSAIPELRDPKYGDVDGYREILKGVITAAQNAVIPDRHITKPQQILLLNSEKLKQAEAFGPANVNNWRNVHRDRKVGAAGELYVFELLKKMGLPGFDMNSWQSTIRDEVRIHQNYRDLTAFQGRETSDIVYNDTKSTLTGILCQAHYLNEQMWAGRNPKYFIEVKTTTEACEHAFYVSAAQLKRMENTSLSSGSEVYILMRVFNLGQGDKIDMRLYVDPYSAKVRGDLTFTASNWLVNPNFSRVFQSASESIKSSPATLANVKSSETPLSQADVASVVVSVGGGSSWPSGSKLGDYKSPSTAEVPYTLTTARGLDTCPTEENHFHSISHMAHYIKWSFEELRLADYSIGLQLTTEPSSITLSTFGHVSSSTKPTFGSPKSQTGSSSGLFTVPPVNPQPNPFVAPLQTTSGLFGGQPTNTDSARNKKAEINTASTLFGRPSSGPSTFGQSVFGQPWFGQHRSDPSLFGQSSFESSQSSTESSRKDATVPGDNDRGVFGSSNTSAQPNKTTDHILDSGLFTKPAGSLFTAENIAQLKKNPGLFGSSTHTKSSLFSTVGGNTLASTPSLAPDQSTRFGGFESSSANAPLTSTLSGPARASIFGASPYSSTQPTSTRAYFGASFGQSTPSSTATAQPGAASGGFGSGSFGAPLSQSTSSSTATAQPSTTGGVFGGGGFSSGGFGAGGFGAPSTLSNLAPANPNPPNSAGTIFGASTSSSTFGQASTTATAFGGRLSNQSRKDDASKERDKKK